MHCALLQQLRHNASHASPLHLQFTLNSAVTVFGISVAYNVFIRFCAGNFFSHSGWSLYKYLYIYIPILFRAGNGIGLWHLTTVPVGTWFLKTMIFSTGRCDLFYFFCEQDNCDIGQINSFRCPDSDTLQGYPYKMHLQLPKEVVRKI